MSYDDARADSFVLRYQKTIFALVLYLIGGDRDKTYDIASTSFAEALGRAPSGSGAKPVLIDVIRRAVGHCRGVQALPVINDSDFTALPHEHSRTLLMTAGALRKVPFEMRVFLLLRDQMHLAYDDISLILRTPEARTRTNQARECIRDEIGKILNHTGEKSNVPPFFNSV